MTRRFVPTPNGWCPTLGLRPTLGAVTRGVAVGSTLAALLALATLAPAGPGCPDIPGVCPPGSAAPYSNPDPGPAVPRGPHGQAPTPSNNPGPASQHPVSPHGTAH